MQDDRAYHLALAFVEAAYDGAPLTGALAELARASGADRVLLYRMSPDGSWSDVQAIRLDESVLAAYRRVGAAWNPRGSVWASAADGEPIDFDRLVPPEDLASSPLGALMQQTGFPARHVCGMRLALGDGSEARLSLGRNTGGAFDRGVLGLLAALSGHLAPALRARARLRPSPEAWSLGLPLADVEVLPVPLAIIDASPRLVHANAALRKLAARRDGLALGQARLIATDAAADRALAAATERLVRCDPAARHRLLGAAVPRAGGGRPYLVQALAIGDAGSARQGVLFIVTDPDAGAHDPHLLRDLLGLTHAEAELATLLARGATLAEAAAARGISVETARTQLKSVLGKTGCRRQAELARVLARLGLAPGR